MSLAKDFLTKINESRSTEDYFDDGIDNGVANNNKFFDFCKKNNIKLLTVVGTDDDDSISESDFNKVTSGTKFDTNLSGMYGTVFISKDKKFLGQVNAGNRYLFTIS